MAVWALGINHTTAPLDLRGRFSFASDQLAPQLQSLRESLSHAHEAAIVSTCNRTEIYCAGDASDKERTLDWLAQCGGVTSHMLRSHTYSLTDDEAARHAFRVASGLDSMVLGEPQILGQLIVAVRAAEGAGALGATCRSCFSAHLQWPRTFEPAQKLVRTPSAWPPPWFDSQPSCLKT